MTESFRRKKKIIKFKKEYWVTVLLGIYFVCVCVLGVFFYSFLSVVVFTLNFSEVSISSRNVLEGNELNFHYTSRTYYFTNLFLNQIPSRK